MNARTFMRHAARRGFPLRDTPTNAWTPPDPVDLVREHGVVEAGLTLSILYGVDDATRMLQGALDVLLTEHLREKEVTNDGQSPEAPA